ncbi:MAG: metallophosphoesterase [Acidimicrobiales bacterium]
MEPAELLRPRDAGVAADKPPARPRHEGDLRFKKQLSTRWFSPGVLAQSGMRVVLSGAFGQFLDKRELQASADAEPLTYQLDQPEVWVDFVADTGDGFDSTYTVAWLAAQKELNPEGAGRALPRGELVILGGDEVYPVGDADAYEQRFVGPFRASLPWTWSPHPELFALAGNHDWYDGLTAFMRIFCQGKWIGGRRTRQTRSYFAIELPHRWWLWGIDIQLDSYIDEPQLRYFEDVVRDRLKPGDRVVLCTATPAWVDTKADARGFKNLAFLESRLIRPAGAKLMLSVSGDDHHYAHFVSADGTHKVTAGGGGAFLHPTHELSDEIEIQINPSDEKTRQSFTQTTCYPDKRASRRLAWGALALPLRNPSFMIVPGLVYLLLGWSSHFSLRAFGESRDLDDAANSFGWADVVLGLVRNPVSIALLLVFTGGLIAFAKPPKKWSENPTRLVAKVVLGLVHLVMHLAVFLLLAQAAVDIALALFDDGLWFLVTLLLLTGVLGGVLGGVTTGLYLALANAIPRLDAHGNETFSAMRLTTYKNFLRMHLDADGVLHVYPIGVRRACKQWALDPDNGDDSASWLAPATDADEPAPHLIEAPFDIDGRRPGGSADPPWKRPDGEQDQPQVLPLREPESEDDENVRAP